jgi:hypothetical protein
MIRKGLYKEKESCIMSLTPNKPVKLLLDVLDVLETQPTESLVRLKGERLSICSLCTLRSSSSLKIGFGRPRILHPWWLAFARQCWSCPSPSGLNGECSHQQRHSLILKKYTARSWILPTASSFRWRYFPFVHLHPTSLGQTGRVVVAGYCL